jgi:hypothetical protein
MCSDTGIRNNSSSAMAYPQQKQGYSHLDKMMRPGLYAFGTIASLQNGKNGNPTWIVSGLWEGSLSMDNKAQGGGGNQSNTTATLPPQRLVFQIQHFIRSSIW